MLFGGALLSAILFNVPAIDRLADAAYARGVITWIIAVATICIGFVLVYQAFENGTTDDRFRRGREIFTGLMGVLGTIVGFYFGSTESAGGRLHLADTRVIDNQLVTFVSGGVPPYRFTVTVGDEVSDMRVSSDGWIVDTLDVVPEPGTNIEVRVKDARNQEETVSLTPPEPTSTDSGAKAHRPQSDTTSGR